MALEDEGFEAAPRRRWPWLLALILLIFAAGMATMAWTMLRWSALDRFLHDRFAGRPAIVTPVAVQQPARVMLAPPLAAAPALSEEVAALSRQVATIDARTRAARGNADRAEGLLVAFAARRALDRGVSLGYIEALLRARFGGTQPQAVAAILASAHQPVTLVSLETELARIAPTLTARAEPADWWTAVRREIAGLIVVRRAGEASSDPIGRLDRARRSLEAGQVDAALAEIARMPGNAAAAPWMTAARRYLAARAALDRIETAALLEPAAPAPITVAPDAEAQPDDNAAEALPKN